MAYDLQLHPYSDRLTDLTVSPHFHRHHDTYAKILIAPTEADSLIMFARLSLDNQRRQDEINKGKRDPGRGDADWFEVKIGLFCHLNTH